MKFEDLIHRSTDKADVMGSNATHDDLGEPGDETERVPQQQQEEDDNLASTRGAHLTNSDSEDSQESDSTDDEESDDESCQYSTNSSVIFDYRIGLRVIKEKEEEEEEEEEVSTSGDRTEKTDKSESREEMNNEYSHKKIESNIENSNRDSEKIDPKVEFEERKDEDRSKEASLDLSPQELSEPSPITKTDCHNPDDKEDKEIEGAKDLETNAANEDKDVLKSLNPPLEQTQQEIIEENSLGKQKESPPIDLDRSKHNMHAEAEVIKSKTAAVIKELKAEQSSNNLPATSDDKERDFTEKTPDCGKDEDKEVQKLSNPSVKENALDIGEGNSLEKQIESLNVDQNKLKDDIHAKSKVIKGKTALAIDKLKAEQSFKEFSDSTDDEERSLIEKLLHRSKDGDSSSEKPSGISKRKTKVKKIEKRRQSLAQIGEDLQKSKRKSEINKIDEGKDPEGSRILTESSGSDKKAKREKLRKKRTGSPKIRYGDSSDSEEREVISELLAMVKSKEKESSKRKESARTKRHSRKTDKNKPKNKEATKMKETQKVPKNDALATDINNGNLPFNPGHDSKPKDDKVLIYYVEILKKIVTNHCKDFQEALSNNNAATVGAKLKKPNEFRLSIEHIDQIAENLLQSLNNLGDSLRSLYAGQESSQFVASFDQLMTKYELYDAIETYTMKLFELITEFHEINGRCWQYFNPKSLYTRCMEIVKSQYCKNECQIQLIKEPLHISSAKSSDSTKRDSAKYSPTKTPRSGSPIVFKIPRLVTHMDYFLLPHRVANFLCVELERQIRVNSMIALESVHKKFKMIQDIGLQLSTTPNLRKTIILGKFDCSFMSQKEKKPKNGFIFYTAEKIYIAEHPNLLMRSRTIKQADINAFQNTCERIDFSRDLQKIEIHPLSYTNYKSRRNIYELYNSLWNQNNSMKFNSEINSVKSFCSKYRFNIEMVSRESRKREIAIFLSDQTHYRSLLLAAKQAKGKNKPVESINTDSQQTSKDIPSSNMQLSEKLNSSLEMLNFSARFSSNIFLEDYQTDSNSPGTLNVTLKFDVDVLKQYFKVRDSPRDPELKICLHTDMLDYNTQCSILYRLDLNDQQSEILSLKSTIIMMRKNKSFWISMEAEDSTKSLEFKVPDHSLSQKAFVPTRYNRINSADPSPVTIDMKVHWEYKTDESPDIVSTNLAKSSTHSKSNIAKVMKDSLLPDMNTLLFALNRIEEDPTIENIYRSGYVSKEDESKITHIFMNQSLRHPSIFSNFEPKLLATSLSTLFSSYPIFKFKSGTRFSAVCQIFLNPNSPLGSDLSYNHERACALLKSLEPTSLNCTLLLLNHIILLDSHSKTNGMNAEALLTCIAPALTCNSLKNSGSGDKDNDSHAFIALSVNDRNNNDADIDNNSDRLASDKGASMKRVKSKLMTIRGTKSIRKDSAVKLMQSKGELTNDITNGSLMIKIAMCLIEELRKMDMNEAFVKVLHTLLKR